MRFKQTEYSKKLKDPRWQKVRLLVYDRDSFTCQCCGATDQTLNCHHKYYEKGLEPWEYPLDALITLCEECHTIETEQMHQACDSLILAMKKIGFMSIDFACLSTAITDCPNETIKPHLRDLLYDTFVIEGLGNEMFLNWVGYKKMIEESLGKPPSPNSPFYNLINNIPDA